MKKTALLWLMILILGLTGCTPPAKPTPTQSPDPTRPIPTLTPTLPPGPNEASTQPPALEPTPTLNRIEQALATQAAQEIAVNSPRTTIAMPKDSLRVASPDGQNEVLFALIDGVPYYSVTRNGTSVILPSKMGFTFLTDAPLNAGLSIIDSEQSTFDETWTQPWGEVKEIRDHHNELRVRLTDGGTAPRELVIVFRVFADGVGFRYEFPEQPNLGEFAIMDEQTEFAMSGDHQAWWNGAFLENRDEYLFSQTSLSQMARFARKGVLTPLTMQTADGLYLSIHEAALVNYSSMALLPEDNLVLKATLYPWSDGVLVRGQTPLKTPWRTIQIAEKPGDLITSYLILNLNEPNALGDASWVKPGKYIGIWWGMHIGKWTWGSGPNHGATTENTRAYLEFAARYGFSGVLVEGWNTGWDGNWIDNGEIFSFTEPYPDFDLEGLATYAEELGVKLIGHHETAIAITNYELQMENAFALYQSLGIDTVKTGYVGYGQGIRRYDESGQVVGMEWHFGQYMVEHYQRVIETAARYGIMIDAHETIKDTGLRRTYPNFMTREAARGQEYNAWDGQGGNPPDHVTILPFTRLLAGPMDYTPGILDLTFDAYRPDNDVNHTLAKELALYIVIYSPLQMAADLIENYEGNPAFQFILDVPTDWEQTRILHAQIGDFITTVRQERDGDEWFLGSITDENARKLEAALDFLTPGVPYVAQIYSDGAGADWETNPYPMDITTYLVDAATVLTLNLAPGGGQAIRFYPASQEESNALPVYQP
ncbi:MAG: glycoside hydrolase family 97 protein [Anaerolineales bacterium]